MKDRSWSGEEVRGKLRVNVKLEEEAPLPHIKDHSLNHKHDQPDHVDLSQVVHEMILDHLRGPNGAGAESGGFSSQTSVSDILLRMGRGEEGVGLGVSHARGSASGEMKTRPTVYDLLPDGWTAPQIFWESSPECLEPETASSARNPVGIYVSLPELLYELSEEDQRSYIDLYEVKLESLSDILTDDEQIDDDYRRLVAKTLAFATEDLIAVIRTSPVGKSRSDSASD